MTRARFATAALLCIAAVVAVSSVGEAAYFTTRNSDTTCKIEHPGARDVVKLRTTVVRISGISDPPARAAGQVPRRRRFGTPVVGAKVITRLKDLTDSNGDNVVAPGRDAATTNEDGVARTRQEVTKRGRYRVKVTVKVHGRRAPNASDSFTFRFDDRESGRCEDRTN